MGESGEFALIDRIGRILPGVADRDVLVGIGDDAAVIRKDGRRAILVTCDIQVEGRHFRFDGITPYRLGRRAMAVNLSDIAAMGGRPTYALVSLGLPGTFPVAGYDRLFEGMRDELSPHGACIVGGNLARTTSGLVVDITLMGEADLGRVLTRGGARAGDRIFVTGWPGASAAGFHALRIFGGKVPRKYRSLAESHLAPTPRVAMGQRIAGSGIATAMIDLSDGLAGDLAHICERSGVGAEIREELFPLAERVGEIAERSGRSVRELVLHGGEDYELLFTVEPGASARRIRSIARGSGVPVTEIGRITERRDGCFLVDSRGNRVPVPPSGWDHFRAEGGPGKAKGR